jgi:hypothetical protein
MISRGERTENSVRRTWLYRESSKARGDHNEIIISLKVRDCPFSELYV